MLIKPIENAWTKTTEVACSKKGFRKYVSEITPANIFLDKTLTPISYRVQELQNHYHLQNQRISLEIGKQFTKIFDREHENIAVNQEEIIIYEFTKGYEKCIGGYGFWDEKLSRLSSFEENETITVNREIEYKGDCSVRAEYIVKDNEALKLNMHFKSYKKEERFIKIMKVWKGIEADTFYIHEVASHEKYEMTEKSNPPFSVWGWKLEFFKGEKLTITEDLTQEYLSLKVVPTIIDLEVDGKLRCEFGFIYTVEPLGKASLDPTTYTNSIITNTDGYIFRWQSTDGYGVTTYYWGFYTYVFLNSRRVFKFGLNGSQGLHERAWASFNVSGIPDGATITSVSYKYEGQVNPGTENAEIREFINFPGSFNETTLGTLWSDIGAGTLLVTSATFPIVGTVQSVDLGSTGVSRLQARLSANYFYLGFKNDVETTSSDKIMTAGEDTSANPKPTLYVEYTVPDVDYLMMVGVG